MNIAVSKQQSTSQALPWVPAAHERSKLLRLHNVVDALVSIAEHSGDTASFLDEATATAMELTRATGAVVLLAEPSRELSIAAARGQMACVDEAAFGRGQTLARNAVDSHQTLHSDATDGDARLASGACARHGLHSLIATPLRYGDEVLGVLEVCSSVPCAFDAIDEQGIALIGNALGGALGRQVALDEHARLLAQLQAALQTTQAKARKYQDAALYDALTGLPNRAHFTARLEDVCREHQGLPDGFAVLFVDLDGFKAINDLHGHAMGDAVLRATAESLTSSVRGADLVARIGGDEFVVLLCGLRDGARDTPTVASNIVASLARPRTIDGVELVIEASVGWAPHDGQSDAAAIVAAADAAMYRNKKARQR
ncbi:diguanylate cyclase domain-containing protein [Lysobacter koreensis]|uniref:Diguanylate cyclase domain-containing protein n=1 Tax=Lysobacter koreensis TaxID=266122 RepID=A0ABW2YJ51_9GAMM